MNNSRPTNHAAEQPQPVEQHDPYTLDKPRCTATYQTERCTPPNQPPPTHAHRTTTTLGPLDRPTVTHSDPQ